MQLVFILEQVLNGLLVGAYYLLIALGVGLAAVSYTHLTLPTKA